MTTDATPEVSGQAYWRSLEEYAGSEELQRWLADEFGGYDPDGVMSMSRRRFMKLCGASMALAGLTATGCRRWPEEKLVPYAHRPDGHVPGEQRHFATMTRRGGAAVGLLVTSYDGRPIKVEGNPSHPISRGATDAFAQASVLELYDPDRSRGVLYGKAEKQRSSWDAFDQQIAERLENEHGDGGSTLAVLAPPDDGPSRAAMRAAFAERFPRASWYEWDPINRDRERTGTERAFGRALRPHYHLDRAQVIACFDADLLWEHPAALKHARDWAAGRRSADKGRMNRLYMAESAFSITGSVADHRLPTTGAALADVLRAVAVRLGVSGVTPPGSLNGASAFVEALAHDLSQHAGEALVAVGPRQPAEVHALAWAINDAIGAIGRTVTFTEEPADDRPTNLEDIRNLADRISGNGVKTLVILGGNPVYDAPADLEFAERLGRVECAIHLGLYVNETAMRCLWHLPEAHELESWSDGRAWDGTVSVQQPLIYPLFNGRSSIELLARLADHSTTEGSEIVRQTAGEYLGADASRTAWQEALREGVVAGSAYETVRPTLRSAAASALGGAAERSTEAGFELEFRPDHSVFDGRLANSGWMQETPDPLTKLTWDNAALINIEDARELNLSNGDLVRITVGDRELVIAAYLMPGQAKRTVSLPLGYGREGAGHVGRRVGFNTYTLRTTDHLDRASGATLSRAGGRYRLAMTQNHHLIDHVGRLATENRVGEHGESGTIVHEASLQDYERSGAKAFPGPHGDVHLQLYNAPLVGEPKRPGGPQLFNEPHAWGMTIDMNACIGCNACVVACQAENNIAVVGKDQVLMSREMQWLRIDRYFKGDPAESPDVVHMPMMCQHCENAPCEQVCPVAATVHDSEGLNTMVYNRCIGTRYCSNNCPYKVRRFNYFDFHAKDTRGMAKPWLNMPDNQQWDADAYDPIKRMVFNPDVTVRMRGVMEKCTYCTQRIARAKIAAKNAYNRTLTGVARADERRESPLVEDGDVVTACQQACPTQAIVFGDLNDADSHVTRLQQNKRAYSVLDDLNTRPRSKYLAKIRNPQGEVSAG